MSKGISAALDKIDRDNRQAAEVILADQERYQGIQLTWARAWMEKHWDSRVDAMGDNQGFQNAGPE